MIKVKFQFTDGKQEDIEIEGYSQLNLLAHAQIAERSVQSRCGGHCDCSTCRIEIVEGRVSEMREEERRLLTRVKALDGKTRLACQCFPEGGNLIVKVPSKALKDAREK